MEEKVYSRFSTISLLIVLSLSTSASTFAQERLDGLMPLSGIESYLGSAKDAYELSKSDQFSIIEGIPNLGVTRDWKFLRWQIQDEFRGFDLLIDNSALDSVLIYNVGLSSSLAVQGGDGYKFNSLGTEYPSVKSSIPRDSSVKFIVIGIKSAEQIVAPIFVGEASVIDAAMSQRELFYGIYFGLIVAMLLYNFFIYLTVRDKTYMYYVFYTFTVGLTQLILNGYANKFLWPNSASLGVYASAIVPILSGWAVILFARHFIQTKKFAPWIDKMLIGFAGLYVISLAAVFLGRFDISFNIINANASAALILIPAAIKGARKGYRPAGFFLVAFGFFLFGVTLFALRNFGVIPFNNFTTYALPIGSAIETILLSFALADRINQFKKEKEESQLQAITVMQENQRLVEEQNVKLEHMVHERTLDLERTNGELNDTLQDLRLTQKQLVESEKLASLGQMTAGIAHEINNPINFVQSNVQPLRRDIDDMLGLLDEFARLENDDTITQKVTALHKRYAELDMPYLRQEVNQLLHGIEEGSRRTAEIVRGLRVFSRMDRDSIVSASINDCIQSTLIVMKNMTKGNVTLLKELKEDLPNLHCLPGKLNQVFMNILTNAVQATDIPGRTEMDRIVSIQSDGNDKEIRVTITDNGIGISDDIRSKIFDPFFTTKQVGEGTGLGLSIALGIVKEHQGQIEVHSTQGKGTTVVVVLPRNAENA